jgi:hypothetical protein
MSIPNGPLAPPARPAVFQEGSAFFVPACTTP